MQSSRNDESSIHDDVQAEARPESSSDGPSVVFAKRSTCARVAVAAEPVPMAVSGCLDAAAVAAVQSFERRHRVAKNRRPVTATNRQQCGDDADDADDL